MPAAYLKAGGIVAPALFGMRSMGACAKVPFESRAAAQTWMKANSGRVSNVDARLSTQMGAGVLRPYPCRMCRGVWHLGHR